MKQYLNKISLRSKLLVLYSAIFSVLLISYGLFTYFSVSNDLKSNLDATLTRVSSSLNNIIMNNISLDINKKDTKKQKKDKFSTFFDNERQRFIGPILPLVDHGENPVEEETAKAWLPVNEFILSYTKSYFIQIADTNGVIVWKTQNLFKDSLPVFTGDNAKESPDISTGSSTANSTLLNLNINEIDIRIHVERTKNAIISVGYTVRDIEDTLYDIFSVFLFVFPIVLGLSILGGLVLSRLSLKQIDNIARNADEITGSNLSLRLEEVETNDEIGHLTKTLNRMIERLETAFKQVKRFTSDASHELKTPLTILRGELEVALKSQKSQKQYQIVIASALEEVLRLSNVVTSLLDLSRADSGQVKMTFRYENLSRLISDLAEDTEILADKKNIEVTDAIERNVYVEFDSDRMHQAVLNIIDNAIKYTPKNGKIKLSLFKFARAVEFHIEDSGMGISPEKSQYIFDRFYRVDEARSSEIHGTGLGLSIVKLIIDAHNGNIAVSSKLNEGSIFKITLPIYQ